MNLKLTILMINTVKGYLLYYGIPERGKLIEFVFEMSY